MIKYLDWDTNFFGFKTGKIVNVVDSITLENILNKAKEDKYKLIYLFTHPNIDSINKIALKNNGLLVDTKITFSLELKCFLPKYTFENIITYNDSELDKTLLSLAFQSGEYSRFKTDKNFSSGIFEKLYTIWMEESVKRKIADEVFVYTKANKICGMITVSEDLGIAKIGLIGVDILSRGEQIGSKLIDFTKNYFNKRGLNKMEVVTQLENLKACAFYKHVGFSIAKSENVYHLWL